MALKPGWADAVPDLASRAASSRPEQVVTSPATRCLLPARMLAELLSLPLTVDPDLLELDFGAWDGLAWDAVARDQLDLWAADPLGFAPPGGESGAALLARVAGAAERLREFGSGTVVVSHGGPLRLLPALLLGDTPDLMAPAQAMGTLKVVTLS